MAKYRITGPDGGVFEINAPDDASPDQVLAFAKQSMNSAPQRARVGAQAPAEPESMGWGDVAANALKNTPASAGNFVHDIGQAISHPIDTVGTLFDVGAGGINKLIGVDRNDPINAPSIQKAEAVGDFFKDRYGGVENLKKTLATDPVGAAGDLATVLTGGGGLALKAPAFAGKVGDITRAAGKVAQSAGAMIDPLSAGIKATGAAIDAGGRGAANLIGGLGTHTGGDSLKIAFNAGKEGGEAADAFRSNLRGDVPLQGVVQDAKASLDELRAQRGEAYRAGMDGIKQDRTVLDFKPIDDALDQAYKVGTFEGKVLNKSARGTLDDISSVIEDWRGSDPSIYHTPEGLDALKKAVGDIRDSTEYGSPSRVIADKVYGSIWDQIGKQAPEYAKVMKGYEDASKLIGEVQKTLSVNPKASVDTALRKLQSVMRNNANTNYGERVNLVNSLEDVGGKNIPEQLAGQALNSMTPRGLGKAVGGITAASGFAHPGLIATLPFQSPRLMGEAAYYAGKGTGAVSDAAKSVKLAELLKKSSEAGLPSDLFQAGRLKDDNSMLARALLNYSR